MVKKILHVFPEALFTESFLSFIETNYSDINHDFILIDIGLQHIADKQFEMDKYWYGKFKITHISTFKFSDFFILHKILRRNKDYDNVIFHSLYLNFLLIALFLNIKVIKRATVIFWGTQDVGPFIVPKNRKYRPVLLVFGFFYEKMRSVIIGRFGVISTLIQTDYDKLSELYNIRGKYKPCRYMSDGLFRCEHKKKNSDTTDIQVGHQASPSCRTVEALQQLSKFKDEKIRIYCPLSYGDESYAALVSKIGKDIFGKKFIPITKLMTPANFTKFVASMDIYTSNCYGQAGLGNVARHIMNFNKIFLNEDSTLYDDMKRKRKYHIYGINSIEKMTFDEFIYYSQDLGDDNLSEYDKQFVLSDLKIIWDGLLLKV